MNRGLRLGYCAVIDAHFRWNALKQDALDALAAPGEKDALGDGGESADDLNRGFDCCVAVVGQIDGDEVRARNRGWTGVDAVNCEIRQTLVLVDPVIEEP